MLAARREAEAREAELEERLWHEVAPLHIFNTSNNRFVPSCFKSVPRSRTYNRLVADLGTGRTLTFDARQRRARQSSRSASGPRLPPTLARNFG